MCVHRDVWVICDFCSESEFAEGNVTDKVARQIVVEKGVHFHQVRHDGETKDICPDCYEKKRHRE